tara:strand:- start:41 stop:304 length:264 start_codon:yes stop_codon:yes gene_type:complete
MAEANKDERSFTVKSENGETSYKVSDFNESQTKIFNRLEKLSVQANQLDTELKEINILINSYSSALVNDLQPSEVKDAEKDNKSNSK